MTTKSEQVQNKKIRNRIVLTFVLGMLLLMSFGLTMFIFSAETASLSPSDASHIHQNLLSLVHISFLFLTLGSVVFMYLMFNLMYSITPGLRRINLAVSEVGKGNFDYRISLPVRNELGDISELINQALNKITQSEQALKREKAEVENTVHERTLQLQLEQAKFLASIKALPIGFLLTEPQQKIVMINPIMGRYLELDAATDEEFDGKVTTAGSFLRSVMSKSQDVLNGGITGTASFQTAGGKYLEALYSPVKVGAQNYEGMVIVLEDVTEAKNLERSKDEFFSIASHELRTPLTAIKGNAELIKDLYAELLADERLARIINAIESSSTRLIGIVNDFLDAAKLEQGSFTLKNEPLRIGEIIEKVVEDLSAMAHEKNLYVTAENEVIGGMPRIVGDAQRIEQVLYNLIGNALKFVVSGGVVVSAELQDNDLKILIKDTGRGISPANQELLFRKFEQANANQRKNDDMPGTGLGLYISKMLVEAMGGKVALESSVENEGSVFSFTLPLAPNLN